MVESLLVPQDASKLDFFVKQFSKGLYVKSLYFILFYLGTSTILVPTGDQDPTVHLNQIFWMDLDAPIFVANQILAHLENP